MLRIQKQEHTLVKSLNRNMQVIHTLKKRRMFKVVEFVEIDFYLQVSFQMFCNFPKLQLAVRIGMYLLVVMLPIGL